MTAKDRALRCLLDGVVAASGGWQGSEATHKAIEMAIEAAIAEEREACAKIVEGWSWPGYDAGSEILGEIAEAIRGQS